MNPSHYIIPNWPAPSSVKAVTTTRLLGSSQAPFSNFNLSPYVGDQTTAVYHNRRLLTQQLQLPQEPMWLQQIHGHQAIAYDTNQQEAKADAAYTQQRGCPCVILTADCLPILICNQQGSEIAAIHAGWKGLLSGVIDHTLAALQSHPTQLLAWLGPAIGPQHFELNDTIREQFVQHLPGFAQGFFRVQQRWFANIAQLAHYNLQHCGVSQIYHSHLCNYSDSKQFYSYRRDQGNTGRMASLIWLA